MTARNCWPSLLGLAATFAMASAGIYPHIRERIYRDGENGYFGWPVVHSDNAYRLYSNAFFIDIFATIIASAAAGVVVGSVAQQLIYQRRFSLQWACGCTAFLATMCGLFVQCRDYDTVVAADVIDHFALIDVIAVRYGDWITAAIIFGETCVPFAAWIIVSRLAVRN